MASEGLRERPHGASSAPAKSIGQAHGDEPMPAADAAREKQKTQKTIGRTPDGSVFVVPQTHDMVSQLLSPYQPKNLSDLVVILVLGLHILTLYLLPATWRIPFFALTYLTWRATYNVGIGWLLHIQSHSGRLVRWAEKSRIFINPAKGTCPHPRARALLKRELEIKIPCDYKFDEAPIEYNTWLVFRRLVDLILLCDFVTFCLFAIACGGRPEGENFSFAVLRWTMGWALVGFNLWVKLDAHRVVKDYAWYWGDFFFRIDQDLTFDGVFEMAPHPMYSVGYAGLYGIAMMAGSMYVFFMAIIAHAAQLAFLVWVENPHIDKIYNPPPRRTRAVDDSSDEGSRERESTEPSQTVPPEVEPTSPLYRILGKIDLLRPTDFSVVLLPIYVMLLAIYTPRTAFYQGLFVTQAVLWRIWYSFGLGFILSRQSTSKSYTRHFLKHGESGMEAWRQWKGLYHLSMTMTHISFIAASLKMYSVPSDWSAGWDLLKHVLGLALIALQIWTSFSIYESLGEFGWFFGDFFFDQVPKLTYSGIYRYLNSPERVIGLAGVWGAVLMTNSVVILFLALFTHVASLAFIQYVERPHMQKLYGQDLRQESGLVKSLKRSLPRSVHQWSRSVDRLLDGTIDFVEDFILSTQPKLAAGVDHIVKDTTALFTYPARVTVARLEPDMAGFDPKDYSLEIVGRQTSGAISVPFGQRLRVRWRAPSDHTKKDWVGFYMVSHNSSRLVTRVSSAGRWVPTTRDQYDSPDADRGCLSSDVPDSNTVNKISTKSVSEDGSDLSKSFVSGEMEFSGDKLWWSTGVFEFRYHHNGKHNVMAISQPFEINIDHFDEDDVEVDGSGLMRSAVEQALLPMVQDCCDRDPEIAPGTVQESFGCLVERDSKYAKRIVYAVSYMFGIEFAPEVVQADGNVRNLAWRICNAKKVLAPYSMSSGGQTTPNHPKY